MPFVARLSGADNVAPLSGIFLAILVIFWLIPYLWKKGTIPFPSKPLLAFVVVALLATACAFYIDIPIFKGVSIPMSAVKGVLTLGIGVSFYLVISTYITDEQKLKTTLQLVSISGLAVILWSVVQMAAYHFYGHFPSWMAGIQRQLSIGSLIDDRASGFALEPSWLAHQLNMLFLPFWLSAVYRRDSVFRLRIWKFIAEDFLLVGGILAMVLTFSRAGWVAFLLTAAFVFLLLNRRLVGWATRHFTPAGMVDEKKRRTTSRTIMIVSTLLLVVFYASILIGTAYVFSKVDKRMATLFDFSTQSGDPILRYANSLKFGERVIYWLASWGVFNEHPWLGVGLGNAGFFFPQNITPYGWSLAEVRNLLYRSPGLLNTKSLWFRLLAETGIIGFAFFMVWLYVIVLSGIKLSLHSSRLLKTVGLAGIIVIIGLTFEGLSIDSFAMPYLWASTGILSAAFSIGEKKPTEITQK
jgi:O-antigen ligase